MNIEKILSWMFVVILAWLPLNWTRLWLTGGLPKGTTVMGFLASTLVCWGLAIAIGYFTISMARRSKVCQAKEKIAMQELLAEPLTEIQPTTALLKSGEKAYGSVQASLKEVKTVGFSAGTTGISFRVAKGLSLRSSSTRGRAVRSMVNVADGELVVTNQRIIFAGDRKGFSIKLDNLINTTDYSDGFGFNDNRSTYTLTTGNATGRLLFSIALKKILAAR